MIDKTQALEYALNYYRSLSNCKIVLSEEEIIKLADIFYKYINSL